MILFFLNLFHQTHEYLHEKLLQRAPTISERSKRVKCHSINNNLIIFLQRNQTGQIDV